MLMREKVGSFTIKWNVVRVKETLSEGKHCFQLVSVGKTRGEANYQLSHNDRDEMPCLEGQNIDGKKTNLMEENKA